MPYPTQYRRSFQRQRSWWPPGADRYSFRWLEWTLAHFAECFGLICGTESSERTDFACFAEGVTCNVHSAYFIIIIIIIIIITKVWMSLLCYTERHWICFLTLLKRFVCMLHWVCYWVPTNQCAVQLFTLIFTMTFALMFAYSHDVCMCDTDT